MKNKKRAVALSYNSEKDIAPKVVASGEEYLADKILEKAKNENVPIHKDEKLCDSLIKLDIGESIPKELYEVVAKILIYVSDMDNIKEKVKR